MFGKLPSPLEKLMQDTIECIDELQRMSALELIERTVDFKNKLHQFVVSQEIPAVLVVGALTDEILTIHAKEDRTMIDENFQRIKGYVDKNFIKREPLIDEECKEMKKDG